MRALLTDLIYQEKKRKRPSKPLPTVVRRSSRIQGMVII